MFSGSARARADRTLFYPSQTTRTRLHITPAYFVHHATKPPAVFVPHVWEVLAPAVCPRKLYDCARTPVSMSFAALSPCTPCPSSLKVTTPELKIQDVAGHTL